MYDDIPEARRQAVTETSSSRLNPALWVGGGIGLVILALGGWFVAGSFNSQPAPSTVAPAPSQTASPQDTEAPETPDTTLGHFAYELAPEQELQAVTADGKIRLRKAAAQAYQQMAKAAEVEGVELQLLSGFRTVEDQNHLFFKVKEERVQGAKQRAKVSAPPGRSEHHTGYAIDIGDASQPDTHVNVAFEQTWAFEWLEKNAPRYSFELSFPKGNPQGVSYEPWHWRYVGDSNSLETFYNARSSNS